MKYMKKASEKGISLIVLIITIVVIVILTTTVMITVINSGVIDNAKAAVIEDTIAKLKEEIAHENQQIILNGGKIPTLEEKYVEGKVTRSVQELEAGSGEYYLYYVINPEAYNVMGSLGKGTAASRKDIFVINEQGKIKYINNKGKEYGDEVEENILADETHIRFKNKEFGAYISSISGATEEDMIFKWMKTQTTLSISDNTVTSLEDLVFFPNLTELALSGLTLENLDGIENCTKLTELLLHQGTLIKDYSKIKNVPTLEYIALRAGAVNNDNFEYVMNTLKDLPNLNSLWLWYNRDLTDLKGISKLKNLETLSIQNGKDFENKEEIGELKKLKSLSLGLGEKADYSIEFVKNLTNLEFLSVSTSNMLSDITPVESCTGLKSLYLSNNNITDITALSSLTNLTTLNLSNNNITDITPLSSCTSLTSLDLKGNAGIDGNRENYTDERLEALDKIGEILDRKGTINIDVDKIGLFTNYKTLNLSNQNMTDLSHLKGLTNLTSLNLSNNQITLEDEESQNILKSMTKLTTLNLSNNSLTDITAINSLTSLTSLSLNGTNNNIDLSKIEDIISNVTLYLSEGQGKTLNNCNSSKVTKLRIGQNSSGFDMSYISNLKNLNYLTLSVGSSYNIENLDEISNMSNLKTLILNNGNLHSILSNINFSGLTNLTELQLYNDNLWSEDLKNLKGLINNIGLTIDLRNNLIIDASALLELNEGTKIKLSGNPNLSEASKTKLKDRFGTNVSF